MKYVLPGVVRAAIMGLALLPLNAPAFSAGSPLRQFVQRDSYQIGEGGKATKTTPDPSPEGSADSSAGAGPIRLARFSYVQGNVTWRTSDSAAWSPATVNLPIRQGAQVWVTGGGRAEVQFDDGSLLRLGNGAVATLQTLFSDADGEFTEIQMNEGLSTLELRDSKSIYQVDTPLVSIKSEGPSKVRIGVDSDVEIAVRSGQAAVEGSGRKTVLESGSYLDLGDADADFNAGSLPDPDRWDQWNDARDQQLADADSGDHLPSDIALVAGDLDDYGSWHDDAHYGAVWCPTVSEAGWRPYQHGHWTWVEPFGWTWVSSESWGWAPYHYGTWISEPYGWAWVPGPARQPWCPAVVHFSEYNGAIAWAPLCPTEVRYPPAFRLGYRGGDWSLRFSIGQAAVYYPYNNSYCTARPFNNIVVNRVTYITHVTNIYNINNANSNRIDHRPGGPFVPFNARYAAGVTTASREAFGGVGEYQTPPRATTAFFLRGRSGGAPQMGAAPVGGPMGVRPTAMAFTPSRTFLPDAHAASPILRRQLFRAALPPSVARVAPSSPRFQAFGYRSGVARVPAGNSGPSTAARPYGVRPVTPPAGADPFRPRRPSPTFQGASAPISPGERARRAALDARRSLGQGPTEESAPTGARREHRLPGDPVSGAGGFRPTRPARTSPGDTNVQENPRDIPREPHRGDVPREPRRPEPSPEPFRSYRTREQSAPVASPASATPERAPREERRPETSRPAPSENKPSSKDDRTKDDHSGDRPGGRSRN